MWREDGTWRGRKREKKEKKGRCNKGGKVIRKQRKMCVGGETREKESD